MGLSVQVVRKPQKPVPEKVARIWAQEWVKEGKEVDWQRLMPPRGYVALPRRWVVERMFSWLSQNRRMSKDYERLCASAETFIYTAMIRLMVRRLEGAKRSRSATSLAQKRTIKKPSAIFQTVSEGAFSEVAPS
jgi:hypothetical protein